MITLLVQPCVVTTGFGSTTIRSHCFTFLVCGLFSSWGDSPLRIGCKVSVMFNQSAVVLDNTTRWKWVKEAGNHQYAPCVNWRRSWFMSPGYSAHTCWIYSFFLSCLAQGQVRVPFSTAHPHCSADCGTLWWTAQTTASVLQNELSAIYRWPQWLRDATSGVRTDASDQICIKTLHSTTCYSFRPSASLAFSSPHQSRPSP